MQNCDITQSYVDKNDLRSGILSAAAFVIFSTTNSMKVYNPGQLIFGRDLILPIKHTVYWELICQQKQTQVNKYNIRKNINRFDHEYNAGDKFMLTNHTSY